MDFGIGIFAELATLAFEAVAALAEVGASLAAGFVELIIYVLELALYVMFWIATPFLPARQRNAKLPERSRRMVRRSIYAVLALGAVFAFVHFLWLREPKPKPQPSPPSKLETARRVIERIKDVLPSKSQP